MRIVEASAATDDRRLSEILGTVKTLDDLHEKLEEMGFSLSSLQSRGGARNFPTGGLTLPTRVLKYGFQGIVNAKNLRQNDFSPSDGGLGRSDRGL